VAYAAQADLAPYIDSATVTLLTDDNKDGSADAAVITGILGDVTARIDSALKAAGYTTPVAVPGAALRSLAARLCLATLYGRRPAVEAPPSITTVAEAAEAELKLIAAGKFQPPEAVRMSSPTGPGGIAISSDATRDWADSELF
jgi:phage gp36-like protein